VNLYASVARILRGGGFNAIGRKAVSAIPGARWLKRLVTAKAAPVCGPLALLQRHGWHDQADEFAVAIGLPRSAAPSATPSKERVFGVFGDMVISTLHFRQLQEEQERRRALRDGLRVVDIEIFSRCNRRCHYCSNSVLDRFTSNTFMDVELYRRIVSDLAAIEFDGTLRFVGLNEPTLYRDVLVERVREARAALPRAMLTVFSNGDYLSRDYLDELYGAGMRSLYISVHLQRFAPFDGQKVIERVTALAEKLDLPLRVDTHIPGRTVAGMMQYRPDVIVQFYQHDYAAVGHDRGGILDGIGRQDYVRTAACVAPIQMMVIAHNGNVMPCAHFVGDAEQHKHLLVGTLAGGRSLFDVYSSPEYVAWRRSMFSVGPKGKACRNCIDHAESASLNDAACMTEAAIDGLPALVPEGIFRSKRSVA
jgi:radical SAM protein with 4Fe4S-binding SPASM domain